MRTYNARDWTAALKEWELGDFGREWRQVRHEAAMRGMIYPPSGTKWDSWDDALPSQRAIIFRAIEDTPALLLRIVTRSRSWNEVVAGLLAALEEWREDIAQRDRQTARERAAEPNPIEATRALRDILDRIAQS